MQKIKLKAHEYFTYHSNKFYLLDETKVFNYYRYRISHTEFYKNLDNILTPYVENIREKKLNMFIGVDKPERFEVFKHTYNIGLDKDSYLAYSGFSSTYSDNDISSDLIDGSLNFYSTGSASSLKHLDKKNKKIINRKTINVCYVFGDITSDTKFHRGRYSDILQYKFISNLVDKFSKQKNIHFYIKCGYSVESEIPNLLNKIKNIPNISIISSTKLLSKKIHNMDLFIISNLSTPLREILATNKSLLIYQNNSTRDETSIFNELLDKRATVIENMKDLNRYLDDFIIQGRNSKILSELKSNNNIFFNTYCLEEDSDPVLNIENNIHNLLNKNQ